MINTTPTRAPQMHESDCGYPLDEQLSYLQSLLTDECGPADLDGKSESVCDTINKLTPHLAKQLGQTHDQIHGEIQQEQPAVADNLCKLEAADNRLLFQWIMLAKQWQRLNHDCLERMHASRMNRGRITSTYRDLIGITRDFVHMLRQREMILSAVHMSIIQRGY